MKIRNIVFPCFLGLVGAVSLSSCKDDDDSGKKREDNIDKFVSSLSVPSQPDITIGRKDSFYTEKSADEICTYKEYNSGVAFNENFLLDPSLDVIYPGAIIDGASINTGDYKPVNISRAPITIYTKFMNKDGDLFKTIEKPDGASVNQAIKELLYDDSINGATVANVNFEVKEIVDRNQLDLELGVSLNAKKLEFSNQFNFNDSSSTRNFLIKYIQPMYDIAIVPPTKPSEWFASDVSRDDLSNALSNNTMPCYVGYVKYGRAVYALMQTEEQSTNIENELKASLNAFIKGKTDNRLEKYKNSSSYSYSGTIIGGNANMAAKGIKSIDDILEYVTSEGNFSKENPAEMLSYKLNKLSDGSTYAIKKAASYTIKNCESFSGSIRLEAIEATTAEHGGGDDLEPYGDVRIVLDGTPYTIFTLLESQKFRIVRGQKLFIQGSGNNASIGGKSCSTGEGPNLNLENVKDIFISVNLLDSDGKDDKNDPYFTFKPENYDAAVSKMIGYTKSESVVSTSSFRNAIDVMKNGFSHEERFFIDIYRVYDKIEYDKHGRKDFFDNPDVLRLYFVVTLN